MCIRDRPSRASVAISPPTYIPISRTAARCSGPRRRSVSGSPISLFAFPSLLSVGSATARTAAVASLVDVFARLPVIPTTSGSNRARQAIGAAWRARFDPLVVGITGSLAKTSTKDATAAVLAVALPTLKSEGNANNEIGLPLTLLRLGPEHRAAVLEMGMYVGGEIATLARLGRPEIGVVTAVAPVHQERAGSLAAIENAKAELVEALPPDGTAVLNADDARVRTFGSRTRASVIRYGFAADADVTAEP